MNRKRVTDIVTAVAAIVVLAILVALRTSLALQQTSVPSTYDTGARGYAALYTLLAREHVPVQRFEEPITHVLDYHGTLVIAGDFQFMNVAASKAQRDALNTWIRRGGTLEVFGAVPFWLRDTVGIPQGSHIQSNTARAGCGLSLHNATIAGMFTDGFAASCTRDRAALLRVGSRAVAIAYRRGKGTVIYSPATTILDNEHLAQRDNAAFAYAILSRGTVMFDEHAYGHVRGNSFWQVLPPPMRLAIIIACMGLLLAVIGANVPFVPPLLAPEGDERDSSEYIASLARMLQRGGAQRAVVQRLCAYVQAVLGPRALSDDQARELLERARALQSLPGPRTEDVIEAGRLFARVRKDYTW